MDKEQIKTVTTEALMIARIKQDILNVVAKLTKSYYVNSLIIKSINKIPVSRFQRLRDLAHSESHYNEEIRKIINDILRDLRQYDGRKDLVSPLTPEDFGGIK